MRTSHKSNWDIDAPLFAASLLNGEKAAPHFLTSASGANDARRYAVYKNNVVVSLVRAIGLNFPAIVRLVGSEYFTALARAFVVEHPPKTRILAQYGSEFPSYLDAFTPLNAYPYLGDVARIEQAWREVFHEADAAPIESSDLQQVKADDIALLIFTAHPATRLLQSRYAAGSIFSANRSSTEGSIFDPSVGEYSLVTRPHFECALRILDEAEGAFVAALLAGKPLGMAVQTAMNIRENFDLAANISGILDAGAFSAFRAS